MLKWRFENFKTALSIDLRLLNAARQGKISRQNAVKLVKETHYFSYVLNMAGGIPSDGEEAIKSFSRGRTAMMLYSKFVSNQLNSQKFSIENIKTAIDFLNKSAWLELKLPKQDWILYETENTANMIFSSNFQLMLQKSENLKSMLEHAGFLFENGLTPTEGIRGGNELVKMIHMEKVEKQFIAEKLNPIQDKALNLLRLNLIANEERWNEDIRA